MYLRATRFDGDGMLAGVYFASASLHSTIVPLFNSKFIQTDVFINTAHHRLLSPLLPSITTLISPATSFFTLLFAILRTFYYVMLSRWTETPIKRLSVANTEVTWWDGKALATCESGPPMRIQLPSLETKGWWVPVKGNERTKKGIDRLGLGGFFDEWTTAHPKVDPDTNEFIAFHSSFITPYLTYSVLPPSCGKKLSSTPTISNVSIEIPSARMMHDFGVSLTHTVILDLPLNFSPCARLSYSPQERCRFGVFERYRPEKVKWLDVDPCLIFHTANTWSERGKKGQSDIVHLLACRMNGDSLIWAAGNMVSPHPSLEPEECLLYYCQFLTTRLVLLH